MIEWFTQYNSSSLIDCLALFINCSVESDQQMARVNKVSECAKLMQHTFTVDGRNKVCIIKDKIIQYDQFLALLPCFNCKWCWNGLEYIIIIISYLVKECSLFSFKNRLYNIRRQSILYRHIKLNKNTIHWTHIVPAHDDTPYGVSCHNRRWCLLTLIWEEIYLIYISLK